MDTKTNKKYISKENSMRITKAWHSSRRLICEEFCYRSGLRDFHSTVFPSKTFELQNLNYIFSRMRNA